MQPRPEPRARGRTRTIACLLAVFGVALAARLVVLRQLSDLTLFQHPLLDSGEYLEWARRIAAGDFSWPAYAAHGPGYPFLLGGLLWLFDGSLNAVRFAQAVVGAGACVLVADIGRRLFFGTSGRSEIRGAGLAAGLVCALYGPLVLNDVSLLAEALLLPLVVVVLWLLALGPPRPATRKGQTSDRRLRVPGRSILIGSAIGLAVIVRPTAVALLVPVTIEAWHNRRLAPRPLARLLVTVAVCAIVVLPVALENRMKSGSLIVQGYGGMNLFLGNDPAGTGLPSARLGAGWDRLEASALRDGVSSPAGQDAYYLRKMVRAILDQPARWVALTAGKALWLVQAEEVRDTHSYYFFSNASAVLRALPGFGATFPLAIVGFVLAFQSGRRPWYLVGCLIAFAVVCVASVVGSRYRLPLLPALIIPAGAAIAAIVERGRALLAPARAAAEPVLLLSPVVPYLVLLVVCVGATNLRGDARSHNFAEEWALTGRALMHDGRCTDAEAAFHRALDADRGAGYAWDGLGACAFEANDLDAAERAFRNAVAADGDNAEAHYHVGVVQERRGAYDRALEEYRRALQISPATASFMIASARSLLAKGALFDAAAWYAKASAAQPTDADAHMGLARVAALAGDWTQGLGEAQRAAALRPSDPATWLLCCQLAADAGDGATARVFLQKATDLAGPDALEVQLGWVYVARAQGNYDEVDQRLRGILQKAPQMSSAVQLFLQNADRRGTRAEADQFLRTLSPVR